MPDAVPDQTDSNENFAIVDVTMENFQRATVVALKNLPRSGIISLLGKNIQGKTSIQRFLHVVFGGDRAVPPDAVSSFSEDGKGGGKVVLSNGFSLGKSFTPSAPKGYLSTASPRLPNGSGRLGSMPSPSWTSRPNASPRSCSRCPRTRNCRRS